MRTVALLLVACLMFAGCAGKDAALPDAPNDGEQSEPPVETPPTSNETPDAPAVAPFNPSMRQWTTVDIPDSSEGRVLHLSVAVPEEVSNATDPVRLRLIFESTKVVNRNVVELDAWAGTIYQDSAQLSSWLNFRRGDDYGAYGVVTQLMNPSDAGSQVDLEMFVQGAATGLAIVFQESESNVIGEGWTTWQELEDTLGPATVATGTLTDHGEIATSGWQEADCRALATSSIDCLTYQWGFAMGTFDAASGTLSILSDRAGTGYFHGDVEYSYVPLAWVQASGTFLGKMVPGTGETVTGTGAGIDITVQWTAQETSGNRYSSFAAAMLVVDEGKEALFNVDALPDNPNLTANG